MKQSRPITRGRIRYDWWRAHHGLPSHAKWRSVGLVANVPVSVAFHIAVCLMDVASRGQPRGSIGEFKPFDCAGIVNVPVADVERVLKVLREIHWIEGHMISQWDERQPQREDAGAAKRAAEYRERHASSHTVTHQLRDEPQSHASEVLLDNVSSDVTIVSAPDRDKKITTTFSEAARELEIEPNNTAGLLATAPPIGALARPPLAEPVPLKPPHQLSRSEFDDRLFLKNLAKPMKCPCCVVRTPRLAMRKIA